MIDPVHMQNIVSRSPEVARVQRVQEGAPEAQSQIFAQELAKETQRTEETVPTSPQAPRSEWKREKRKKEERERKTSEGTLERRKEEGSGELGRLIDARA